MADTIPPEQPTETAPGSNGQKKQTSRISLESTRPLKSPLNAKKATSPVPGIPTRPAAGAPIPQTIRLKRPPTSQIALQPVTPSPPAEKKAEDSSQAPTAIRPAIAETIKRQTAPISPEEPGALKKLADFKQTTGPILGIPTHTGPIPQTIRLKRPPTAPLVAQPLQPVVPPTVVKVVKSSEEAFAEAPTVIKEAVPLKDVTARIVLEEPGGPASAAAAKQATARIPPLEPSPPPIPKTIRLKRPPSISAEEEPAPEAKVDQTAPTFRKTETSKIELPVAADAPTAIAPRKTIKIKRTEHPAMPLAAVPEAAIPAAGAESVEEDQGLIFPIVAGAAIVCIAALVYIMAAQAFGVHLPLPASMQLH